MIRVGDVLAVKIRRKCTAKQWQVPFDTVDVLIQAGTLVHDAVSIAPVQAVSTVLVSVLRTIQTMRQNKKDCEELVKDLVDIHNEIMDILKGYSELPSAFIQRCNKFHQSLVDMSESLNSIARLGPIRSFIKSSTIKKEIQGHRQRLQDSNQRFNTVALINIGLYVEQLERVPRDLGYPWQEGKRLRLIDAMNITLDLPIELCYTWEDFNDFIKFIFRKRRGKKYIDRGDYDLIDQQHQTLDSSNWHTQPTEPRLCVIMDVILQSTSSESEGQRPCPACGHLCTLKSLSKEMKCEACGCTFRMSKLSVEPQESSHMLCPSSQQLENHQSSSISSYAEPFPQTITPFIEPSLDQAAELDDIRYFRRIHVKVQVTPERPEVMSIERPSRTIKFNPKAFSYGFDIQATEHSSQTGHPEPTTDNPPSSGPYLNILVTEAPLKDEAISLSWPLVEYNQRKRDHQPLLYFDIGFDPRYDMNIRVYRSGDYLGSRTMMTPQEGYIPVSSHCMVTKMVIVCKELSRWPVIVGRPEGLRCFDVFYAIYKTFQVPLTEREKREIDRSYLDRCRPAFEQRCKDSPGLYEWNLQEGMRRVDLLRGRRMFKGIKQSGAEWTLMMDSEDNTWL